jgi:selenide,water dikinase
MRGVNTSSAAPAKRLTEYANCAGCAAKLPQGRLGDMLRALIAQRDPRLLVGPETCDDAGVVEVGSAQGLPAGVRLGLVQTVDFFPPVVDDPYFYGAVAAANALSDVYAMGGAPLAALNLASFPAGFPSEWAERILRGGFDKVREAGAVVAGGHTVESEILFGFAVTGFVDPAAVCSNAGARAGDQLYLTKALGMGCMTTAAKKGAIGWAELEPAARQMASLNDRACAAMLAAGASACTDVTGFGLVGHALNVARASGLTIEIETAALPLFEGALELARRGLFSGGAKRGRTTLAAEVELAANLDDARVGLCFDAETSGGLLIAIPTERAARLERELAQRALPVVRVGACRARGSHPIALR